MYFIRAGFQDHLQRFGLSRLRVRRQLLVDTFTRDLEVVGFLPAFLITNEVLPGFAVAGMSNLYSVIVTLIFWLLARQQCKWNRACDNK